MNHCLLLAAVIRTSPVAAINRKRLRNGELERRQTRGRAPYLCGVAPT